MVRAESQIEIAIKAGVPAGHYLALGAGERLELSRNLRLAERSRQAVFVGKGEMVVVDRVHRHHKWRFQLPDGNQHARRNIVASVVLSVIRQKPIGWKSLGTHLLLFFDRENRVIGRLDNSIDYGHNDHGTWEFNYEDLKTLCQTVGVEFRNEHFSTAKEFIGTHPDWAPPDLEFQANHLRIERVREWGLAIALGLPIAVGLAVGGTFLMLLGPAGWFVSALELLGIGVAVSLTIWGHSKWRLKRSLRRVRSGGSGAQ